MARAGRRGRAQVPIPPLAPRCCQGARSDTVDKREVGAFWLSQIERAVAGFLRRRAELPDGDVLDIRYADLVTDTVGTMHRIFEFIGVPLTGATENAMRRWLAENPPDRYGAHRYAAEEFGLDPSDLAGRFAAYRDEFGL